MDIEGIRAMHKKEERLVEDPYLPRGVAISMLQQAHQQRGWLLERLEQVEREHDEALAQLEGLASAQRERHWME